MTRYALLLLLVLSLGSTAWGQYIGLGYIDSPLTIVIWSEPGISPSSLYTAADMAIPDLFLNPDLSPPEEWPVDWTGTAADSASYAGVIGPGARAISVTVGGAITSGNFSNTYSYSEGVSPPAEGTIPDLPLAPGLDAPDGWPSNLTGTSSNSLSYAATTRPGAEAVSVTFGTSIAPGSYSSSYSYSESVTY